MPHKSRHTKRRRRQTKKITSPFSQWALKAKEDVSHCLLPGPYVRCFHAALGRVSSAINPQSIPSKLLRKDDDAVIDHFYKTANDNSYFDLTLEAVERSVRQRPIPQNDIADHFFYGSLSYRMVTPRHGKRVSHLHLAYRATDTFMNYSYENLHLPWGHDKRRHSLADLGYAHGTADEIVIRECASNYLARNFWHNIVHDRVQNITNDNFDDFRGRARYDSDFEADNFSLALLVHSYGLPIIADDIDRVAPDDRILHVLRRNQCNDLFRARAVDRGGKSVYDETEFRHCRTINGYLCGWLLAQGLSVVAMTVHAYGYIKMKNKKYYREGEGFVISVNGYRIRYTLPYPADGSPSEQLRYMENVGEFVQTQYGGAMRREPSLRKYAKNMLKTAFARVGAHL
jgi:hypothetical protein